jgi:hypothetical protein
MSPVRPAAGGGRWVEVAPTRLERWLSGFVERHGQYVVVAQDGPLDPVGNAPVLGPGRTAQVPGTAGTAQVPGTAGTAQVPGTAGTAQVPGPGGTAQVLDAAGTAPIPGPAGVATLHLRAADGAFAQLHPSPGMGDWTDGTGDPVASFVAAATAPHRIGLLLARQGSVAVGIAEGATLLKSTVDSHYVQGRTAAGGWSQQRFARRRANQAKAAAGSAADHAVRILAEETARLAALVTGGDRRTVDAVLADPRLSGVAALRSARFLDVGEPRRAVLEQATIRAAAVVILVRDATNATNATAGDARGAGHRGAAGDAGGAGHRGTAGDARGAGHRGTVGPAGAQRGAPEGEIR